MMDLDPRRLLLFEQFAIHLNFTRAARALHVTQPALHMQVRQLQEEAGQPLYTRTARGLKLTAAGTALAQAAGDIRRRLSQARADVTGASRHEPVVLCAGEGALLHLLPAGIRAFVAHHRHGLRILTLDRDAAVTALRDGTADVAVTSLDSVPKDLLHRPLSIVGAALALPRGHALARRPEPLRLFELAELPLIVPPQGSPLRTLLDANVPNLFPVVETHGWEVMLRCVAWNMGLAVVNAFCVPPKGVVLRPIRDLPARRYQMVWHPNRDAHERVTALRQALLQPVLDGPKK